MDVGVLRPGRARRPRLLGDFRLGLRRGQEGLDRERCAAGRAEHATEGTGATAGAPIRATVALRVVMFGARRTHASAAVPGSVAASPRNLSVRPREVEGITSTIPAPFGFERLSILTMENARPVVCGGLSYVRPVSSVRQQGALQVGHVDEPGSSRLGRRNDRLADEHRRAALRVSSVPLVGVDGGAILSLPAIDGVPKLSAVPRIFGDVFTPPLTVG